MNKKIIAILMLVTLVFSISGCNKAFNYEEAMDEAMETLQNAKTSHTYSTVVLAEDSNAKLIELAELMNEEQDEITYPENMEEIASKLSNIELAFEQKVDLNDFNFDMDMLINYESEGFINLNMFLNDEFIFFNEPDLLKQGAMIKLSFLTDMMSQMPNAEETDIIGTIKSQVVEQQEMTKKLIPIIDQIIDENVAEPEVLETTIEFQGNDLKTNEVKYSMDYVEALELAKIFLDNEEFLSLYEEVFASQVDYMTTMSGGMAVQSKEEMIQEFHEGIDEMKAAIDEVLADEEVVTVLENYNLDVSYFFDDGIKSVKYDFDFFSIKSDYYSINEDLTFDIPTEESSFVVEDEMGIYGLMGIVNQEAIQNLQNHKLVTDLMELQSTPEY